MNNDGKNTPYSSLKGSDRMTGVTLWIFLLVLCKSVTCRITGETEMTHFVGDNAHFRWNTDNNSTILSAAWGIKKGNTADPELIQVDMPSEKTHFNPELGPDLIERLSFDGDLKKGRAWFTLKNVTVNDTNEYLATIDTKEIGKKHYPVALTVKKSEEKDEVVSTQPQPAKTVTKGTTSKQPTKIGSSLSPEPSKTPPTDSVPSDANDTLVIACLAAILGLILIIIMATLLFFYKRKSGQAQCPRRATSNL